LADNAPLILVTNDDGIRSPGLLAAAQAVADLGELLIVAPVTQQTGMGRATPGGLRGPITREVLRINGRDLPAYAVPGTPAQAVVIALAALAPRRPVLAVAGINYGENIASIVTGSGTVGAALEAAAAGIPALAVSLETMKEYHYEHAEGLNWDTAADVTRRLVQVMLERPMPFDVDILNVNVPESATPETPWRVTRQSRQHYFETFRADQDEDPLNARLDYRLAIDWDATEPDCDVRAFADRLVAITPLSIDLTSRTDLEDLGRMLQGRMLHNRGD
jgi:5'-nucleotidase